MKYTEDQYLECGFYSPNEDQSHYSHKIVRIRKEKKCVYCHTDQPKGANMYFEKCILRDHGWVSAYTCLRCLDNWIDENKSWIFG